MPWRTTASRSSFTARANFRRSRPSTRRPRRDRLRRGRALWRRLPRRRRGLSRQGATRSAWRFRPRTCRSSFSTSDRGKAIDIAKTLGLETVVLPPCRRRRASEGRRRLEGARRQASAGTRRASRRSVGLKLAWHNHDFEYLPLADGSRPIDHILSAHGVMFEPDVGWIVRAGADIATELAKFGAQGRGLPHQGHRADGRDQGRRLDRRRRRHHRLEGAVADDRRHRGDAARHGERQPVGLALLRGQFLQVRQPV